MPRLHRKDVMAASVMQGHGRSIRSLARDLGVAESSLRERLKRFRNGVEADRIRTVCNCLQYFSADTLRGEFEKAGFRRFRFFGDVARAPFDASSPELAIVAGAN